MKPSYEWNESDILELIKNEYEENVYLDYKASASLKNSDKNKTEISKDVSAFANSTGGTIVYGVEEHNKNGRRIPKQIDGGCNPAEISKEWVEQVINSRIQPRIDGIRINSVPLEKTAPGRVLYIVFIPESYTVHQAYDRKYYKRFNFESIPMEDYEVRLVMNKTRYPLLVPNFGFETMKTSQENHTYRLKVDLINKGMVRAIDIAFHIWWPIEVSVQSHGIELKEAGRETMLPPYIIPIIPEVISGKRYRHFFIEIFGSKRVIFPTEVYPLIAPDLGPFHVEYLYDQKTWEIPDLKLRWKLYAADAPPQEGEISFKELNKF